MCYIRGGQPEGACKSYLGCTDITPPKANKNIQIPNKLYFSKSSSIWEHGGVAFIKAKTISGTDGKTLGRMYLITTEQYVQVVRQENAVDPDNDSIDVDFIKTIRDGESMINGGWYSRILYLGMDSSYPIFTFTAGWDDSEIELNVPGKNYLQSIIKGIKEAYNLDNESILKYLVNKEGIKGYIEKDLIYKIIEDI
jgi:hypothetical protein